MQLRFAAEIEARAIKYFGTTEDYREAGYILADGTMLDLSGSNQGGSSGTRALDHRELGFLFEDEEDYSEYAGTGWEHVVDFMNRGHIRFGCHGDSVYMGMIRAPTNTQRRLITAIIKDIINYNGQLDVYIDAYSEDGRQAGHAEQAPSFLPTDWLHLLKEAGL